MQDWSDHVRIAAKQGKENRFQPRIAPRSPALGLGSFDTPIVQSSQRISAQTGNR